ncbi:hypothetical protein BpJC7_20980 [Weizmannia acidilactici]|uniref:Esterase Ig-like N-terminal domain-containing protein n=1 Tax=Weizmannia acidilactici TaxID=2607726 RepID=A0A5J4JJ90_9BACI|nr:hypothetical protein BpJC4_25250 [Weizmannia acidilactici]GER70795.1 hypothetical protein BpJC7_20980 [Weizmannia acidilactici]GER74359.1 hypothetical protein BpPP18_24260 [Weizmannia acidilactici]
MIKKAKKWLKTFMLVGTAAVLSLSFNTDTFAKEIKTPSTSYRSIIEIEDWGAAITKVIADLGKPVPQGSVSTDTFKVHVVRSDERLATLFLEEGDRIVTKAYASDKCGHPAKMGKYVVLEMKIAPDDTLGSALNYDAAGTRFNDWIDYNYTITQQKAIITKAGTIQGLVIKKLAGEERILVDEFDTGKATYGDITLPYASGFMVPARAVRIQLIQSQQIKRTVLHPKRHSPILAALTY